MKTTFNNDVCKIMKGAMMIAYSKKEGTLYMTSGSIASISVASSEYGTGDGHMNEKGMKVMLSKDKLPGLKSINLDFIKTTSTRSSGESVSQRRKRLQR